MAIGARPLFGTSPRTIFSFASRSRTPQYAPGKSPIEQEFEKVLALQDSLDLAAARPLNPVSKTLRAVANDEYVWRRFPARELGVSTSVLKYPIDQEAKLDAEENLPEYSLHQPYRDILRGLRMYDGEMASRVVFAKGDLAQVICIRRANNFLDIHFPRRLQATKERHRLYAATTDAVIGRAPVMGVAAGLTLLPATGGTLYATAAARSAILPKAVAAKSALLTKLVGLIGLKATKLLLFSALGYAAFTYAVIAIGFGRVTYNEYLALQSMWRAMETKAAATRITAHLEALGVKQQVLQRRKVVPNAGLNDIR